MTEYNEKLLVVL